MASPTRWTWVWVSSGSWWWTGRPGMLQSMGLQRVRQDWATELKHMIIAVWERCCKEMWGCEGQQISDNVTGSEWHWNWDPEGEREAGVGSMCNGLALQWKNTVMCASRIWEGGRCLCRVLAIVDGARWDPQHVSPDHIKSIGLHSEKSGQPWKGPDALWCYLKLKSLRNSWSLLY